MHPMAISGPIISKAKELNVNPSFLLYSIACAADNRSLDECFSYCFRDLSEDINMEAKKMAFSTFLAVRRKGEYLLSDVEEDILAGVVKRQQNNIKFSIDKFIENHRPIKHYHLMACQQIFSDVMEILSIAGRNNLFDPDDIYGGFFPAIKFACQDEMKKMGDLNKVFDGRDLILN
jgi:hypothetical protein